MARVNGKVAESTSTVFGEFIIFRCNLTLHRLTRSNRSKIHYLTLSVGKNHSSLYSSRDPLSYRVRDPWFKRLLHVTVRCSDIRDFRHCRHRVAPFFNTNCDDGSNRCLSTSIIATSVNTKQRRESGTTKLSDCESSSGIDHYTVFCVIGSDNA